MLTIFLKKKKYDNKNINFPLNYVMDPINSSKYAVRCSYSSLSPIVFILDLSNFIDEHGFEILYRVS